ncbi:BQ5605_C003g02374 [Microbotryum silenes-dioicae]|uniref:BQ5605_C003g02374 protein n=1 Tax=Microbotryum silenes-dioicae TaxID=796604 RepID=A0A2X0M502_9BASI|nr:BQ5605_C003g02374 [Microbotryum silenes-dioicae]
MAYRPQGYDQPESGPEYGAFFRSNNRAPAGGQYGLSSPTPASAISNGGAGTNSNAFTSSNGTTGASSSPVTPPSSSSSRVRGAPRLGGLGLGGIGANVNKPSPGPLVGKSLPINSERAKSPASASSRVPSSPSRVPNSSTPSSSNGDSGTGSVYAKRQVLPSKSRKGSSPKRATYTTNLDQRPKQIPAGLPSQSAANATVERPFLSPEMTKPSVRSEAFALDRPTPDYGVASTHADDSFEEEELSPTVDGYDENHLADDNLRTLVRGIDSPDSSMEAGFSHFTQAITNVPVSKSSSMASQYLSHKLSEPAPVESRVRQTSSTSTTTDDDASSEYNNSHDSAFLYQEAPTTIDENSALAEKDGLGSLDERAVSPPPVVTSMDSPRSFFTESELAGPTSTINTESQKLSEAEDEAVCKGDSVVEPEGRSSEKVDRAQLAPSQPPPQVPRSVSSDTLDAHQSGAESSSAVLPRRSTSRNSSDSRKKSSEAPPRPKRLRAPGAKTPLLGASPALSDGSFSDLSPATSRDSDPSPSRKPPPSVESQLVVEPTAEPAPSQAASASLDRPSLSTASSSATIYTSAEPTSTTVPTGGSNDSASSYSYAGLGLRMPSTLSRTSRRTSMQAGSFAPGATAAASAMVTPAPVVVQPPKEILATFASPTAPQASSEPSPSAASDLKREMQAQRERETRRKEEAASAAAAAVSARPAYPEPSSEEEEEEEDEGGFGSSDQTFATPRPSISNDVESDSGTRTPTINLFSAPSSNSTKSTITPPEARATVEEANPKAQSADSSNATGEAGGSTATDIGVAAVGALVTGSLAVGYTAWRGLGAVASWGWGTAGPKSRAAPKEDTTSPETSDNETDDLPGAFGTKGGNESLSNVESEGNGESEKALFLNEGEVDYSSAGARRRQRLQAEQAGQTEGVPVAEEVVVIDGARLVSSPNAKTEWGDLEFPAPEGFLEELQKVMAELGPEDFAAHEKVEFAAQQAAYDAANALHNATAGDGASEDDSNDSASDVSSPPPPRMTFPTRARKERRVSSASSPSDVRHDAIEEDDDEGTEREYDDFDEIVDLITPMYQHDRNPEAKSRYRSPPGLAPSGIARSASMMSSSSATSNISPSLRSSTGSINSSTGSISKRSSAIFGFGRKKTNSQLGAPALTVDSVGTSRNLMRASSSSPSINSTSGSSIGRSRSIHSLASETSIEGGDGDSFITSDTKTKRLSFFGFKPKKVSSASIESSVGDTTYVSYSSGRSAARRGSSTSSDPLSPVGGEAFLPRTEDDASVRRSSLRAEPRFGRGGEDAMPTSPAEKRIYRVRFANATRGIGLRSVAESEAVRGGDETHALKWVGVGRGRYGNLVLTNDAQSDEVYAEQVAQIKKNRRFGPGAGTVRDWSQIKVD